VATALEKLADPPDDDFSGLVSLITVKVYRAWPDVPLPERAYPDSAGYDLVSAETIEVGFGENKTVSTGLMLEIPPGWYGRIQARSSTRSYVAPGIIDSDYRDTVKIGVYNHHSTIPVRIFAGQVIAQFTLHQETVINWQEVTSESALSITERGKRGFGSSDDDGK
jgi:deoxyuridine 5'-triphosphate nucleotidohydrolase